MSEYESCRGLPVDLEVVVSFRLLILVAETVGPALILPFAWPSRLISIRPIRTYGPARLLRLLSTNAARRRHDRCGSPLLLDTITRTMPAF